MSISVLFVCQANICRSPLAAGILRCLLRERGLEAQNWQVGSAGTWAREGMGYDPTVIEILRRRGGVVQGVARCINSGMVVKFNLILVMERGQKEALRFEFPQHGSKIYLLSEMAGLICSIQDPSGGLLEDYERTASEIEQYLNKGWKRMFDIASNC